MSVAEELETQKTELEKLIARAPAGPDRNELRDQLDDVLDKIANYVDDSVDKETATYAKALAELQASNAATKDAQDDLGKTAEVIAKVAKAMGFVQKVIEAAA
jgi:hypothetical protein